MKISLATIHNSFPKLQNLAKVSMRAKTGIKMLRLLRCLQTEYETIERQRAELVRKYGKETPDQGFAVPTETFDAFKVEFLEMLSNEIEVDLPTISLDELELNNIQLSPESLVFVEPFLTE